MNWPITTDDSTMMAPTDRSMPAVRMTSVCAAPTMPTIATCCRISVSEKAEKNLPPTSDAEHGERQHQHDQRHRRRVGVQEVLRPSRAAIL